MTINENKLKDFVSKWLDGISYELNYWDSVISDDESWNSYIDDKLIQDEIDHDEKVKKILDAGSGPVTVLSPNKYNYIFSCDPLAEYYKLMLNNYNRKPIVNTEFCFSERLYEKYEANFFDEVHMQNALDHSFFPMNSIYSFLYVLKIGCKVILKHYRNEAETEFYNGFHQFNIDVENDKALLWNKREKIMLNDVLKDLAEVNCYITKINNRTWRGEEDFVIIEITKKNHFNILDYVSNNYYLDKYLFLSISFLSSLDISIKNHDFVSSTRLNKIRDKLKANNSLIRKTAWWIPIKKYRDKFRNDNIV